MFHFFSHYALLSFSEEALQDLSGFEMIWVIAHMHLNKGWNSKVRPPRLPEERKGLFSTRSPHRPNALALSSLRVSRVDPDEGVIYVQGLDLLDGEFGTGMVGKDQQQLTLASPIRFWEIGLRRTVTVISQRKAFRGGSES